jgi:hypothetical protein
MFRPTFHSIEPNPPAEPDGGGAPQDQQQQPEPQDAADDIAKLRKALEAERNLKRQLESQLKQVSQVDPRLVEEARAKAEAAEQQRQLIEQQTAARLQEQERKYQEQLARVTGDLQAAKTAAEREALRIKTEREFLAKDGLAEASPIDGKAHFDAIWSAYGDQIAEDSKGLYMLDSDGSPKLDPETGKRVTPGELFLKLRRDPVHGVHFKPEYGSGSGARSGRDGRVSSAEDLSKVPNSQLFREHFGARRKTA